MALSLNKPKSIKDISKYNSPKTEKEFVKSIPSHGSLTDIEKTKVSEPEYPWEDQFVRDDVLKLFNVRLPEKDWLKLKFLSEHTNKSMHQFCLDFLISAINKEVKRIIRQTSEEKGKIINTE